MEALCYLKKSLISPQICQSYPILSLGNVSMFLNDYQITVSRSLVDRKVLIELTREGHSVVEVVDSVKFSQSDKIALLRYLREQLDAKIRRHEEEYSVNLTP